MSDNPLASLTVTTDELRKIIREEVERALVDIPTVTDVERRIAAALHDQMREVTGIIDARMDKVVDLAFVPVLSQLRDSLQIFTERFNNHDKQLAVISTEIKGQSTMVKDVQEHVKRVDTEQDTLKITQARLDSNQARLSAAFNSLNADIFGSPDRKEAGSLVDNIQGMGQRLVTRLETMEQTTCTLLQPVQAKLTAIETTVTALEARLDQQTTWIQARQRIETFVVQSLPKGAKWLAQSLRDDWVKWLIRVGLTAAIMALVALVERIQ